MQPVQVPHLEMPEDMPFAELGYLFLTHQSKIEAWFRARWQYEYLPLMASVDIRNAGFKVAPVDTNLFPAGFNNLNDAFMPLCVQAMQYTMMQCYPECSRILIIAENHSRNVPYFENLFQLQKIFQLSGYEVCVGRLETGFKTQVIDTSQGPLTLHAVDYDAQRLHVKDFKPCLVVLNRDLSEGAPTSLMNIKQRITPPISLGWFARRKSDHFHHYESVCQSFARLLDIDPWLIAPAYLTCDAVDFKTSEGLDCLVYNAEKLLTQIKTRYDALGITHQPFIAVKSDSGTYGMGVMMITKAEELKALNRKQKNKMSMGKGRQAVEKVILQEGVYSFDVMQNQASEPVVYMIGQSVVGGFYRMHKDKGTNENLNAPGMAFRALAFPEACNVPSASKPNRFYVYGVIARLALLAAMKEYEAIK